MRYLIILALAALSTSCTVIIQTGDDNAAEAKSDAQTKLPELPR